MYHRTSHSGHQVTWEPDDLSAAAQALADVDGTGVSTAQEARDAAPLEFGEDRELANRVTERYVEILQTA